ncbi:hypothetical protein MRX96_003664 [Rhipicephalus microplus]
MPPHHLASRVLQDVHVAASVGLCTATERDYDDDTVGPRFELLFEASSCERGSSTPLASDSGLDRREGVSCLLLRLGAGGRRRAGWVGDERPTGAFRRAGGRLCGARPAEVTTGALIIGAPLPRVSGFGRGRRRLLARSAAGQKETRASPLLERPPPMRWRDRRSSSRVCAC